MRAGQPGRGCARGSGSDPGWMRSTRQAHESRANFARRRDSLMVKYKDLAVLLEKSSEHPRILETDFG